MELSKETKLSLDDAVENLYGLSIDSALLKAADLNLDVIFPKPSEIFIDIDGDEDRVIFISNLEILRQYFNVSIKRDTSSPSEKPGRAHIVLDLGDTISLTSVQRLLLQACLGSDRKRELLGWLMHELNNEQTPTLFFEKKNV